MHLLTALGMTLAPCAAWPHFGRAGAGRPRAELSDDRPRVTSDRLEALADASLWAQLAYRDDAGRAACLRCDAAKAQRPAPWWTCDHLVADVWAAASEGAEIVGGRPEFARVWALRVLLRAHADPMGVARATVVLLPHGAAGRVDGALLRQYSGIVQARAARLLSRRLPRATVDQAGALDARERAYLRSRLEDPDEDEVLRIATLQGLARFGDDSDVLTVHHLCDRDAGTPEAAALRETARECLAALLARHRSAASRLTLVRPAHEPAEDALPRPAPGPDGDPNDLVRPAEE